MTAEKIRLKKRGTLNVFAEGSESVMSGALSLYFCEDIVKESDDEAGAVEVILKLCDDKGCALRLFEHDKSEDEQVQMLRTIYRAIGRSKASAPIIAVIPSVVMPSEADRVRKWASDARESLKRAGEPFGRLRAGIAVETPSAAILADLLAPMSDFFVFDREAMLRSLERGCSKRISETPMHESVERCLKMASAAAKREGIGVLMMRNEKHQI